MKHLHSLLFLITLLTAAPASAEEAPVPVPDATEVAKLLEPQPGEPFLGSADAPVTIIEYASLSCSHCAHFHADVLPELTKLYLDTGKARLIARSFVRNEPDLRGTMLLSCVPPEKYYSFLKVMLKTQDKWAFNPDFLGGLETIANVGGVSSEAFNACVKDADKEKAMLEARQKTDAMLNIQGTPSFYINGRHHTGAPTVDALGVTINGLLGERQVAPAGE